MGTSKASVSLSLPFVDTVRTHEKAIKSAMRESVNRHSVSISTELAEIGTRVSLTHRAKSAMVFALMSAQAKFVPNVQSTQPLVEALDRFATRDELRDIIRENRLGLQENKSERLFQMGDYLRTIHAENMTKDALLVIKGLGQKTSAMAAALFNEHAPVYTLDVWMLRGLAGLCGMDAKVKYGITDAAYRELEALMVQWARETAPEVPVFLTQWAMWNDFGFNGVHQRHTAIFGLD